MKLVFLVTALVTVLACPLVLWLLKRRAIMDVPNYRSGHTIPTPRGGGIAALAGMAAGAVTLTFVNGVTIDGVVPWQGLLIAAAVAVIGLVDDLRSLPATFRLLCQIVAGGMLGLWLDRPILILVGIVALVWIVNVTNFMDGINGISALTCMLWGAVAWWAGQHHQLLTLSLLGAISVGIGIGFLPFNAPKAKMFPGDVGAYLYGALFTLGVVLAAGKGWQAAILTLTPLSVYMADTSFTLTKRVVQGHNPMKPHREFVFHRLVITQGWPHWIVATLVVGLSALITAPWMMRMPIPFSIAVTLLVCAVYVVSPELLTWLRQRIAPPPVAPDARPAVAAAASEPPAVEQPAVEEPASRQEGAR